MIGEIEMKKVKILFRNGQIIEKKFKEFNFEQNRYLDNEGKVKIMLILDYVPLDGEKVYINSMGIDFIDVKGV